MGEDSEDDNYKAGDNKSNRKESPMDRVQCDNIDFGNLVISMIHASIMVFIVGEDMSKVRKVSKILKGGYSGQERI